MMASVEAGSWVSLEGVGGHWAGSGGVLAFLLRRHEVLLEKSRRHVGLDLGILIIIVADYFLPKPRWQYLVFQVTISFAGQGCLFKPSSQSQEYVALLSGLGLLLSYFS